MKSLEDVQSQLVRVRLASAHSVLLPTRLAHGSQETQLDSLCSAARSPAGAHVLAVRRSGEGEHVLGLVVSDERLDALNTCLPPQAHPAHARLDAHEEVLVIATLLLSRGVCVKHVDVTDHLPSEWGDLLEPCAPVSGPFLGYLADLLDDSCRGKMLSVAQMYTMKRAFESTQTDTTALDLQRSPGGEAIGVLDVSSAALAGVKSLDDMAASAIGNAGRRQQLRAFSLVPHWAVLESLEYLLRCALHVHAPAEHSRFEYLAEVLGLNSLKQLERRTGLVADQGGTGYGLADEDWVTSWTQDTIPDVVVLDGMSTRTLDQPITAETPIVMDMRNIEVVTWLNGTYQSAARTTALAARVRRADMIVVGSQAQRDFVLGLLSGGDRVNVANYDGDASLQQILRIDPSGESIQDFVCLPRIAPDRAARLAGVGIDSSEGSDKPSGRSMVSGRLRRRDQ